MLLCKSIMYTINNDGLNRDLWGILLFCLHYLKFQTSDRNWSAFVNFKYIDQEQIRIE